MFKNLRFAAVLALAAPALSLAAQTTPPAAAKAYVDANKQQLTDKYVEFLSIPNVTANKPELKHNAEYLMAALKARGADSKLLTAPGLPEDTPPVVWGEFKTPGAKRTLIFYAHYDGQPVTPSEWVNGDPFKPYLKQVDGDTRVYARGAGDDKMSIFAQLTALDALKSAGIGMKSNIRFVWEGEEENGSLHFKKILEANKDLVTGDVWLFCDGPVDQSGKQLINFGDRGDAHVEITVYGPKLPLHSGHYGNWVPNPTLDLVKLLAAMKDDNGHVLIPHFYDGMVPFGPAEKKAVEEAPDNEALLKKKLLLGSTEGNKKLLEAISYPSLNINGISGGVSGLRSSNVIPTTAVANLDLRLPVGISWETQQQRVIDFVKSKGFFVTRQPATDEERLTHAKVAYIRTEQGENAVRAPLSLPIAQDIIHAVESARGSVVVLPASGGTGPHDSMKEATGADVVSVAMANFDDNQHAANENLRLQNLWDGAETMAALIAMP